MKFKVIAVISVALLLLGATVIILALLSGEKTVVQSIASGGGSIAVGGSLLGVSVRMRNKEKERASGDRTDRQK